MAETLQRYRAVELYAEGLQRMAPQAVYLAADVEALLGALPHAEAPPTPDEPYLRNIHRGLHSLPCSLHRRSGCETCFPFVAAPTKVDALDGTPAWICSTCRSEIDVKTRHCQCYAPSDALRVLAAELRALQRYQVALVDATDKSVTQPSNESDSFVRWSDLQPIADTLDTWAAASERPS